MAAPPTSTKTSLQQRLSARARQRWPQLAGVDVRFRSAFAYVTATMPDGDSMPLMRLQRPQAVSRASSGAPARSPGGQHRILVLAGQLDREPQRAADPP